MFVKLAIKSLVERKGSVILSILAMTVSIFVLLGVEHIRYQAKESFASTVSGVDLIVGARTGSLNLLLYSVFRVGEPTNNIALKSFEALTDNPKVKWAIPISLGDSHKGYRVLGTTQAYFQHYRYGKQSPLVFNQGRQFKGVYDVVLGAAVAQKLHYQLGRQLTLSHGIASTSFSQHKDKPFKVVGILAPTGTPVDQTLHVSLASIEAIHMNGTHRQHLEHRNHTHEAVEYHGHQHNDLNDAGLQVSSITAALLGLHSKVTTFQMQRAINNDKQAPLLAILPGVALTELWQMMKVLENTLFLVSALVFFAACLGVSAMLLSSVRERNHEITLLRIIGASPFYLCLLIQFESLLISVISVMFGAGLLLLSLAFLQDYFVANFGLQLESNVLTVNSLYLILAVLAISDDCNHDSIYQWVSAKVWIQVPATFY